MNADAAPMNPVHADFLLASLTGDIPGLERLLDADEDLVETAIDDLGLTCMHAAATGNAGEAIRYLATRWVQTNGLPSTHHHANTPPRLRRGAPLHTFSDAGYSPIYMACHHGCLEAVKALVELGALEGPEGVFLLLIRATCRGHVPVVEVLVQNAERSDPGIVRNMERSLLCVACGCAQLGVAEWLLTRGVEPWITEPEEALLQTLSRESDDGRALAQLQVRGRGWGGVGYTCVCVCVAMVNAARGWLCANQHDAH
jgi:ankyrin repeat protein